MEAHHVTLEALTGRYLDAIVAGEEDGASEVVDEALINGIEAERIIGEILTPAMRAMGDMWERNEIGIADEHVATAITERTLARLYPRLFRASPLSRERVLLAAVEGEKHLVGLQMVNDMLEGSGYETLLLGADVPISLLLTAVDQYRPAVVALGCTGVWSAAGLQRTLDGLRSRPSIPIIFGGLGVPENLDTSGLMVTRLSDARDASAAVEAALAGGHDGPTGDA
jgi:methanogenic corrinoid protein MtbC1